MVKKNEIRRLAEENKKSVQAIKTARPNIFLIKHAAITEKSNFLTRQNKYVFAVDFKANKPEIAKAVKSIYKVDPVRVNIVNIKGKTKRFGTKTGKLPNVKKAIVTLKKGQKIEVMPT